MLGAADPARSPLREGPAGMSEGSAAASGDSEHLQQVMGSLVGGEGAEAQEGTRRPSRRHRSDVHQSDDNRRETRPEFLDRQVTPEQHRSDGCMSTYTWVLFKRKHFRTTRSAERTVAAVGGPPVTYGRILHCGSLEALAPALFKGQQHL